MSPLLSSLMARVEGAEQPLAESASEGASEVVVRQPNEGAES